ncbi:MAG TPA: Gfo/Idh/MocA family oxidoreductase [Candidatus Paceibacterota bacterium]|nr:Gfo/Idh/MocA family oxidoreductase [Candidatus Paceibacterota bacterium]
MHPATARHGGPPARGVIVVFLPQIAVGAVAVSDLAQRNLKAAVDQVNPQYKDKACATHGDYRELLARPDIDAVLIATPDHWHVPVAVAAARAGKDMYLEKPMGLTVAEDQFLRKTIQDQKRIFQFGTQQRSQEQFRLACELVRNGRIGKLQQINVWCSASMPGGSTTPAPVPSDLNYDLWLGPARHTPYTPGKCFDSDPPATWKTWWFNYDYALGFIAGWGVHPLDIAYWGHPQMMSETFEVEGKGVIPTEGACNTSVAWDVNFTFADGVRLCYRGARNGYEPVTPMNDLSPWAKKYGRAIDHGTAFEGTDGWILVDRGAIRTSPEHLIEDKIDRPGDRRLIRSSHHVRNFLDSVKSRVPAICPIEDAVQADILCHLSDIATRLDRKLKWNPRRERFVRDDDANRRLAYRPVRPPWNWR